MVQDVTTTYENIIDTKLFPWWILLIWGILTMLIGCMFLISPGMTTVLLITFMGAYWLVGGLFAIGSLVIDRTNMGWKLFLAIINIIAGALILLYPLYSTVFVLSFFVIFIGFWACFIGVAYVFRAFTTKDAGSAILGVISLIFGFLLLINPFVAAALLPFITGGFAIAAGLATIVVSIMARKGAATPAT